MKIALILALCYATLFTIGFTLFFYWSKPDIHGEHEAAYARALALFATGHYSAEIFDVIAEEYQDLTEDEIHEIVQDAGEEWREKQSEIYNQ